MLQLNEIRLGNWFKDFSNKPFQFSKTDFVTVGIEQAELDEIIKEPIVLSQDWLLKLGFTCQNSISQHYKRYLNDVNSNCCYVELKQVGEPIWKVGFVDKWCINPFMKDIKFVHQLQNIWFVYNDCEIEVVSV